MSTRIAVFWWSSSNEFTLTTFVRAPSVHLNFFENKFKPQAKRLTFRELGDSAKCKIYASAGKIDLSFRYHNNVIQHTPCCPDSGRSDTGQSSRTGQSNSSVQSWTLHEKYAKYPITHLIAHECFMACNSHKTSIV